MADVNAFDGPLVLMLGGRDKKLPWSELAKLIHQRVRGVVLFGEAASLIEKALKMPPADSVMEVMIKESNLKSAVEAAYKLAKPGDTVLFSPGGTSYDEFKDFAERGERFKQWLQEHIDNNP
jgi:UDP-N-acetylmuramoylalanine--D-glutamate ligase